MMRTFLILLILLSAKLQAQTLSEFITIAKQNNSQIAINTIKHEIAQEKVNEVGDYEYTEFSLGVFVTTPETYVGTQILSLGVSQDLPWFGTKNAGEEVQKAKASVKMYDIELSEKDLIYQVKIAYYQLYQKQALSWVYDDNKLLLSKYEGMALADLEANKASMGDVLKITIQKNELHSDKFQNINSIKYLNRNFNRILQRSESIPLYITDSLSILDLLLTNNSVDEHPSIEKISALKTIYESELTMVKKDKAPKVNIGVDYILINQNTDYPQASNGVDVLMPKLSIAMPLLNNRKLSSQENQILLKEKMLEDEIENQKKILEIELEKANLELDNAILRVVAAQKNMRETQRAININLKAYETGLLNYEKVVGLQLQIIKYQTIEIAAVTAAFMAKAKIEYLTE